MRVVDGPKLERIKANNGFFDFDKLESDYGLKSRIEFDNSKKKRDIFGHTIRSKRNRG